VARLVEKYGQEAAHVEREVMTFLGSLADRGLLQETP
jgi:hypothetical protein